MVIQPLPDSIPDPARKATQIPDCSYCNSEKVTHEVDRDEDGAPTNAWFECGACGRQWTNFRLSAELLGVYQ